MPALCDRALASWLAGRNNQMEVNSFCTLEPGAPGNKTVQMFAIQWNYEKIDQTRSRFTSFRSGRDINRHKRQSHIDHKCLQWRHSCDILRKSQVSLSLHQRGLPAAHEAHANGGRRGSLSLLPALSLTAQVRTVLNVMYRAKWYRTEHQIAFWEHQLLFS